MIGQSSDTVATILAEYERSAEELGERLAALDTGRILTPVQAFLPAPPAAVLDVGAGTGRDAVWFAARGHPVWAVEPVAGLRQPARARHGGDAITWLSARLPDLDEVRILARRFDLVLVNAVWHHLPGDMRPRAMETLARLVGPGGRLILSVRDGPANPERPAFPGDVEGTIAQAQALGLRPERRTWVPAMQQGSRQSGVIFTWLVFSAE